jgi:hypothetical protein
MTEKSSRPGRRLLGPAILLLLLAAVAALTVTKLFLAPHEPAIESTDSKQPKAAPPTVSATGTTIYGAPAVAAPVDIGTLDNLPLASVIVSINEPARVWRLARDNAWFQDVLDKPLGRGFLGTWAGFLSTRGDQIQAEFKGMVIEHLAERVLAEPFRAVWFSAGGRTTGKPAIILEEPSNSVRGAFALLDKVATRGTFTAAQCYNGEPPEDREVERSLELEEITIKRWLLADHAVYAALQDDRMVIGRRATLVLQGMCADLPQTEPMKGSAFEVGFISDALGRGANLMTHLLGVDEAPRIAFGIRDGNLVPLGIQADVVAAGHLETGKLNPALLRAIPEEAPVVFTMQLALPRELHREALRGFFAGAKSETTTRQIAVIWYPSGESDGVMDIALLWSNRGDGDFVDEMFGGDLIAGGGCAIMVRCTSDEICASIQRTCAGKDPSVLQAAPAVKDGWQGETSIALGIQVGRALSDITVDAYLEEHGSNDKRLPPEIQEVKRQLRALPFFAVSGKVQGQALVPGGFRS